MSITPATPSYEAETTYAFRVRRVAWLGSFKYLPRDEHRAAGTTLNRLIEENGPDVIALAEPV
ncbi:MAG: hypothetical protein BGO05_05480 [Rhizobiales bacterium 63-7]|nr:hypothetical protein [Hyphomicrobiales bacterium]OJU66653.1 MAG: hypothetical protein BGO05_05480 [Rhizobiales bacterium 63-7]